MLSHADKNSSVLLFAHELYGEDFMKKLYSMGYVLNIHYKHKLLVNGTHKLFKWMINIIGVNGIINTIAELIEMQKKKIMPITKESLFKVICNIIGEKLTLTKENPSNVILYCIIYDNPLCISFMENFINYDKDIIDHYIKNLISINPKNKKDFIDTQTKLHNIFGKK